MTRDEALELAKPPEYSRMRAACATGTDGRDWYRTFRMDEQEWTQRLYAWPGAAGGVIGLDLEAEDRLDPGGVDWIPGRLEVDPARLPPLPSRRPRVYEVRTDQG